MGRRQQVERLRERVAEGGGVRGSIDEADQELLEAVSDRLDLLNQAYTDERHAKLLNHGVIIAEALEGAPLSEALTDRDRAEDIVRWINTEYENEETNRDYRSALRVLGKRAAEALDAEIPTTQRGIPESLAWVPTGTSSDYDPTPDPRDMVRWEADVQPMLEHCYNARDRAMIALQFDAGLRGGEFKALTVGDIQDHDHGLQVTVEGKQGRRTVLLVPSVPYVAPWLEGHPAGEDPDAPLWSKLNQAERLSHKMLLNVFKEAADRAGVTRPVTLTAFRKSSAAFLASRNLNQAHIEDHHGWVRGSDAAARYIAVFGDDTDRELARLHGRDVADEEPDPIGPIDCHVCGRANERDASYCQGCGQALTPGAAQTADDAEAEFSGALAELPPDVARRIHQAIGDALGDAEVLEALDERDGGHR